MRRAGALIAVLGALLRAQPASGSADDCFNALLSVVDQLDSSRTAMVEQLIAKGDVGILVARRMIDSVGATNATNELDALATLLDLRPGTSGATNWTRFDRVAGSQLGTEIVFDPGLASRINGAQLDTLVDSDEFLRTARWGPAKKQMRDDGFYSAWMKKRILGQTTPSQNLLLDQMFPGMSARVDRNWPFTGSYRIPDALKQDLVQPGAAHGVTGFNPTSDLAGHFDKHVVRGGEFPGITSQAQYQTAAAAMANRQGPTVFEFNSKSVTDRGRTVITTTKYDAATGEFVVFDDAGTDSIRTYHKLDPREHGCKPPTAGYGGLGSLAYFLRMCNLPETSSGAIECRPRIDTRIVADFGCK